MKIHSLVRETDLIFNRFQGTVTDHGDYMVIQTPSNPGFHWGNYILFAKAPKDGDLENWTTLYRKEFNHREPLTHMTFTWDTATETRGRTQPFIEAGFNFEQDVGLTASQVHVPPKFNKNIQIKKIQSEQAWEEVTVLQILTRDPKYELSRYEVFKKNQVKGYRDMVAAGIGTWFGAYLNETLVGDLGIFCNGTVGRYQNVGTHPGYRRQGICSTLVYEAAKIALTEFGVTTLVINAAQDYHAAKIYESVGFQPTEKNFGLTWVAP